MAEGSTNPRWLYPVKIILLVLYVVFMNFLTIQVIFQINELENSQFMAILLSYNKTEEKSVGQNSQERYGRPTFRIVILDVQGKI